MRLTCLTIVSDIKTHISIYIWRIGIEKGETRKKSKQILLLLVIFIIVLTIKSMQRNFIQWKLFKVCSFIVFCFGVKTCKYVRKGVIKKKQKFVENEQLHSLFVLIGFVILFERNKN